MNLLKRAGMLMAVASFAFSFTAPLNAISEEKKAESGATVILADALDGSEGIALCPDSRLFVVDAKSGDMLEVVDDANTKLFAEGFKGAAGLACGADGTIYSADYSTGGVSSISPDGKTKKLIAGGFKTPNGIAVASDGTVYMSDSTAGIVHKISPDGTAEKFLEGINFANGLLLSADESLLYVAQTTPNKIIVAMLKGENSGKKKTYASKLQMVDGIAADAEGNIYACLFSTGDIVKVGKDGAAEVIASGLRSPATPAIKNGVLYATSVLGKGLIKLPLNQK